MQTQVTLSLSSYLSPVHASKELKKRWQGKPTWCYHIILHKDDRESPLDGIPKKNKKKKNIYIYIYKVAPNFPTCWPGTLLSLKSQVRGTQIPSKQLRSIFPYIKIDWGGITSWQLVQFLNKKSSNFRPLWHYFHDQFLKHRDKYSLVLIYTMVFFLI